MNKTKERADLNASVLLYYVCTRCGIEKFLDGMKISRAYFIKLICGEAEFTQDEMCRSAVLLGLSDREFCGIFFYPGSLENQNFTFEMCFQMEI